MAEFLFLTMNPILLAAAENLITLRSTNAHEMNKRRATEGEYHLLFPQLKSDEDKFLSYMRMSINCFYYIEQKMKPTKTTNFIICPISNEEKLMLTIR